MSDLTNVDYWFLGHRPNLMVKKELPWHRLGEEKPLLHLSAPDASVRPGAKTRPRENPSTPRRTPVRHTGWIA